MTIEGGADEKVSILLVDDQPGNLLSLKAILERPDYELVAAHSGPEALKLILRHEFAAILLDVAMPDMDGFEIASIVKQRAAYRTIPILFVTASVEHVEWIFRAYGVGAVDFLQKPLDAHQVRAKVAVFVELYRQRRQLERQAERLREQDRRERAMELEELRSRHEQQIRGIAEAIPHIVWVASPEGRVEYVNRRWTERTGRPDETAMGDGWLDAVHPDDRRETQAHWIEAVRGGSPFDLELRLRMRDGTFRWHYGRALRDDSAGATATRWVGTFSDADTQRRARDELRSAVRLRDEFLAVASHELRTPLTALRLRLEKVQRDVKLGGEPAQRNVLEGLEQSIRQLERLNELVNRTLDASRLASGALELSKENLDLAELVRESVARLSEQATRAGCEVTVDAPDSIRGAWDRLRLEQLVTNLLTNAFKYGAGKPVSVRVLAEDDSARIEVRDQGIGISPESVHRIFGRFERAVSVSNYGGLGLGLYVVAQIVEAHGGRVEVETEPGHGAIFVVRLPLGDIASETVRTAAAKESEPLKAEGESTS